MLWCCMDSSSREMFRSWKSSFIYFIIIIFGNMNFGFGSLSMRNGILTWKFLFLVFLAID